MLSGWPGDWADPNPAKTPQCIRVPGWRPKPRFSELKFESWKDFLISTSLNFKICVCFIIHHKNTKAHDGLVLHEYNTYTVYIFKLQKNGNFSESLSCDNLEAHNV